MRPKRIRLGYSVHFVQDGVDDNASMRPKRIRLGYSSQGQGVGAQTGCFNEAQAYPPGIFTGLDFDREKVPLASMRPKRIRLGYSSFAAGSPTPPQCFNEAQAYPPGIFGRHW